MTDMRKESEQGWIYVYVTDILLYSGNLNNIVIQVPCSKNELKECTNFEGTQFSSYQ